MAERFLTMTLGQTGDQTPSATRLYFADRLKVALTMLVIAHHSAQPYGPTGGAWPVANARHSALLEPFFAVNAAFFMGLFFLISGLFVPQSYDHKGPAGFLKSRLVRLGIPTAAFALLLTGPLNYLALNDPNSVFASFVIGPVGHTGFDNSLTALVSYLFHLGWQPLFCHLWFLLHLMLYGLVYVLWRKYRPAQQRPDQPAPLPSHGQVIVYLLLLAGVTWLVRIWYPIDRWVALFYLIPAEIAHLPQYLSLFFIGVLAARRDWPRRIPTRLGLVWLRLGLTAAGLFYLYRLAGMQLLPGLVAKGGPSLASAVWCLWEAVICVGLVVGLPVWFRERFNRRPGGPGKAVASAAYGAYIIHFLIVITLQYNLQTAPLAPLVKFGLVTAAGIVVSFGLSHALKQIPGVSKVL